MKIDVTGEGREGLIELFNSFPYGKLIIEDKRIVWKFTMSRDYVPEPSKHLPPDPTNPIQPLSVNKNPLNKMKDYLFNAFDVKR